MLLLVQYDSFSLIVITSYFYCRLMAPSPSKQRKAVLRAPKNKVYNSVTIVIPLLTMNPGKREEGDNLPPILKVS